jgi:hypothetical protein
VTRGGNWSGTAAAALKSGGKTLSFNNTMRPEFAVQADRPLLVDSGQLS